MENVDQLQDYDFHKLVSFISDKKTGLKGFIAIHRVNKKLPAFGATRLWEYKSPRDALSDALRLSKTMSRKAALAGLRCGGAKAVIISGDISNRGAFFKSYAEEVNHLGGTFITGADVGVDRADVIKMRRFSKYFVGTKVDPVKFTGLGLLYSVQTCLNFLYGSEDIRERSFAIQGVGKIGSEFLKLIYPKAKKIYIADIDNEVIESVKKKFPGVLVSSPYEIYRKKVDVFSPCALGNCLNNENFNKLMCKVIVGGANCQLESPEVGLKIHKKGILYAPDYLVNAGGLISVYDEYENNNARIKRINKRVRRIKNTLNKILLLSREKDKPTFEIANELSERIIKKLE